MLAILVSRDFVIVRLRRLVRGESAPSTRDAVDAVDEPARLARPPPGPI
jgi:hypothetical protein